MPSVQLEQPGQGLLSLFRYLLKNLAQPWEFLQRQNRQGAVFFTLNTAVFLGDKP